MISNVNKVLVFATYTSLAFSSPSEHHETTLKFRPNGEACCDTFALMGGSGEESGFDSSIVEDGEGDNIDILKVYMAPVLKQPRHMASGDNRGQKVSFGLVPICLGSRFETKCRK